MPAIALVLAGAQAMEVSSTLRKKARAQEEVVESILRWKQGVQAVAGSNDRWNKVYAQEGEVQDLVALLGQLQIEATGLSLDADKVYVASNPQVKHQNVQIGLTRVCLASADGGEALLVRAPDYRQLLSGLRELATRPQLTIGSVSIQGEKQQAVARLGELCVLVRK